MEQCKAEAAKLGTYGNGCVLSSDAFGTREMMQGKYLTGAATACFGPYGSTHYGAFYPDCSIDADGEALDCPKHNGVLHFDANQLPPTKAFWSLSMY